MATSGTNITSISKPAVGVDTGPTWATNLNTSLDAIDGHDHSTNKGVRITPAAVNINADLEFNQNSASELKNVIFDSSVTAATTSYSLYQTSGNLFWRNGSGTAVQVTIGAAVNSGAGSISGMSGTDAGASYTDSSKTFNFFTDSGNSDYGKMAHADLVLFKFSDDNSADTDYVTIAANSGVSGSSGTIYVPSENGTFLTTATNYAGAINIATSNSNNPINLKPHGTGYVVVGNGGATGKVTSNGAYDLILDTNSGTNSSSIAITDAANGSISFIPNGTGEIVIGSGASAGKITSSGAHDLVLDTNAGTNSGSITIVDGSNGNIGITPNGTGEVDISKVDIDGGAIDGTAIGATSHSTGKFTTCDATTDFTIGGTVITDNTITDDGTLIINASTATSFSDGNITNVGDIDCDTISVDAAGTGLDIQFGGNTTLNKISLTDNLADALNINQGGTSYMQFVTTNSGEKIVSNKDMETAVSTNIVERGSCFHSTINRSLVFGY